MSPIINLMKIKAYLWRLFLLPLIIKLKNFSRRAMIQLIPLSRSVTNELKNQTALREKPVRTLSEMSYVVQLTPTEIPAQSQFSHHVIYNFPPTKKVRCQKLIYYICTGKLVCRWRLYCFRFQGESMHLFHLIVQQVMHHSMLFYQGFT